MPICSSSQIKNQSLSSSVKCLSWQSLAYIGVSLRIWLCRHTACCHAAFRVFQLFTKFQCASAGLLLAGDLLDLCTCLGHQLQAFPVMENLPRVFHTQPSHRGVFTVWLHILLQDRSGFGCSRHSRRAASCHHHLSGTGHKEDGKAQCYCQVRSSNVCHHPSPTSCKRVNNHHQNIKCIIGSAGERF